jgi:impB/mucB/samB family
VYLVQYGDAVPKEVDPDRPLSDTGRRDIEIAPEIEDRGIDEIYIDLTNVPGVTVELAHRIKANVRRATGLSCSIGITARTCLQRVALDRKLRLLGIRIASLGPSQYVGELSTPAVCPEGDRDMSHDPPPIDTQR